MKRDFMAGYREYDGPINGSSKQWRQAFAATMGLDEAKAHVGYFTPESILGVHIGASWTEIVTGYRANAKACHPDRCAMHGMSVDDATERFKKVTAAFTILKDRYGKS